MAGAAGVAVASLDLLGAAAAATAGVAPCGLEKVAGSLLRRGLGMCTSGVGAAGAAAAAAEEEEEGAATTGATFGFRCSGRVSFLMFFCLLRFFVRTRPFGR